MKGAPGIVGFISPVSEPYCGTCNRMRLTADGKFHLCLLKDDEPLDRTTTNSWEDIEFVQAVHATGRRKLILCALWTEICMAFTALDALREGYEVYPVVDAIGGTSPEAHRAGLDRVMQAGGQPVSWVSLAVELQRDWARQDTVQQVIEIVLTDRLAKEQ